MKLKAENSIAWHNTWGNVDETSNPEWFVKFLDASRLRQLEFIKKDPSQYFSFLNLKKNTQLIDVGCGTGILLHPLAEIIGSEGRVVGIDVSEFMIKEARKRAELTNLPLEFYRGDVYKLDFPKNTFDRAMATTLFLHLTRPLDALNEIKRIVKKNGMIALTDQDWSTLTIAGDYPSISQKVKNYFCNSLPNGKAGSMLEDLCNQAYLTDVYSRSIEIPLSFEEFKSSSIGLYHAANLCVNEGLITSDEMKLWYDDLDSRNKRGDFKFTFKTTTAVGIKP